MHKPVRGVLRLEIEKHQTGPVDLENVSESGSVTNESVDPGDNVDSSLSKCPSNGSDAHHSGSSKWYSCDGRDSSENRSFIQGSSALTADDVSLTCLPMQVN